MKRNALLLLFSLVCIRPDSFALPQWHTLTLDFEGPHTSEDAEVNPFLNYRLVVDFRHAESEFTIQGFYAADGNAAETSASSGNIWRVRFTPDRPGDWEYEARLFKGPGVALEDDLGAGRPVEISDARGTFRVTGPEATAPDFRAHGRLGLKDGLFHFPGNGEYWLKGGANSPENFLAFHEFDGTYRFDATAREGEAAPTSELHHYPKHVADWQPGDPTWQGGKGKGIIGAVNYLAAEGMNSIYFLTMNIGGDGKDVWPYVDHHTFDRFDCSKLAQWEVLFSHMQAKGILLHVVTQETENERLLDDGDTGPQRRLYYRELVARFGHHLGLVWNLGEENGPADFSPHGQTTAQRRAMAAWFARHDPYDHPVFLHTHAWSGSKDHILTDLLGNPDLDGLSFQVDHRDTVNAEVIRWHDLSTAAGNRWAITMDEIGMWHTGALPDAMDPDHDSLRRHALWGSLLAGAAGVEWYFGGRAPQNDLTSEDWRERARLWAQTSHALAFFNQHLPWWEMKSANTLSSRRDDYCFAKPGEVYVIYGFGPGFNELDLQEHPGTYSVHWYDPLRGGALLEGTVSTLTGPGNQDIGYPLKPIPGDPVALVRRID